ncbi:MAG: DUF4290 domain-containing protein [Bacteroidetes bacterium]|nr:DUF4290 domain-containing protein [Bacteroidota bacterium]
MTLGLLSMEDSPEKQQVVETIANFIKMSHPTWNRDSVEDEVIREQLNTFLGGQLGLRDDIALTTRFIDFTGSTARTALVTKIRKTYHTTTISGNSRSNSPGETMRHYWIKF